MIQMDCREHTSIVWGKTVSARGAFPGSRPPTATFSSRPKGLSKGAEQLPGALEVCQPPPCLQWLPALAYRLPSMYLQPNRSRGSLVQLLSSPLTTSRSHAEQWRVALAYRLASMYLQRPQSAHSCRYVMSPTMGQHLRDSLQPCRLMYLHRNSVVRCQSMHRKKMPCWSD